MKKIIGLTLGNCVHVAGTMNYLNLAEKEGYKTEFVGIGIDTNELIEIIGDRKPDIVGLSYRLSPEPLNNILKDLKEKIEAYDNLKNITWLFGGTEPTALVAKKYKIFDKIFYGSEDIDEVIAYIKGQKNLIEETYSDKLIERIHSKYPYPVIRHHLGLTSKKRTIEAIKKIANEKVLDIISIAPDQNAQEFFFDQENMDENLSGAGGVPIRNEKDLQDLYNAAQRGNFPLLRSYSGLKTY